MGNDCWTKIIFIIVCYLLLVIFSSIYTLKERIKRLEEKYWKNQDDR